MTRRGAGLGLVVGLLFGLWAAGGVARADLNLALYAPTAPLESAEARFAFVERLARHLQGAGIPVVGRAFARSQDLESAIKRGQVDLAILDALYLAERGASYPVLAVATAGGEVTARWGLYTAADRPATTLQGLTATRLSWVQAGGRDSSYIDNVFLEGEIKTAQFFVLRPPATDLSGAISDVLLRRADCVFASEQAVAGKGLRRVLETGRIPHPALVQVQARLDRTLTEQIQRAMLGAAALGGLDGWRASAGEPYRQLRARLQGRAAQRRLVMSEPQPLLREVNAGMLVRPEITPTAPPLRTLLSVPAGAP